MKKYLFFAFAVLCLTACHESLEQRAEREADEFTRKNCPMPVSDNVIVDSMKYEKTNRTIHYYYSIKGLADTTLIATMNPKKELLQALKDDMGLRLYKEERFNFAYTYYSTKHRGMKLVEAVFTPKDYLGQK